MHPAQTIPDRPGRHTPRRESGRTGGRAAFTLLELAVTITVIVLVASLALPTITHMMTAGADEQAHNLVTAQLMAARAYAITNETFAGIHVQLADPDADNAEKNKCYSAVISYDTSDAVFRIADGFRPRRLPGTIALGEISDDFVTADSPGNYTGLTDANLPDFCSFSVIFSSTGSAVKKIEDANVLFDGGDGTFTDGTDAHLWKYSTANGEKAVTAFTIFDYIELITREPEAEAGAGEYSREDYLNDNGQFLPINPHTGLLFERR